MSKLIRSDLIVLSSNDIRRLATDDEAISVPGHDGKIIIMSSKYYNEVFNKNLYLKITCLRIGSRRDENG